MNNTIVAAIKTIKDTAVSKLKLEVRYYANELYKAHNRVCEDELDGMERIYYINCKDDVRCLLDGDMKIAEITEIASDYFKGETTGHFIFDENMKIRVFQSFDDMNNFLSARLERIVGCVLAYPHVEEYQELYGQIITDSMEREDIVLN